MTEDRTWSVRLKSGKVFVANVSEHEAQRYYYVWPSPCELLHGDNVVESSDESDFES